jgi:hypothetical protein
MRPQVTTGPQQKVSENALLIPHHPVLQTHKNMEDQQIQCRFTLQTALPAEEIYIGGSNNPQQHDDNESMPNIFYLTGQTLYDLKRAFPLQGTYHFRCLSANGDCWIDLIEEQDDLIVQDDNTIDLKVLDLGPLQRAPIVECTYEEEMARIKQIEQEKVSRPYCIVPDNKDTTAEDANNVSVKTQAQQVAKAGMQKAANLANKMKGFFR